MSAAGSDDRLWGIVGAGRVARQFARAINSERRHRVHAVVSRTPESAERFVRESGVDALAVSSLDELLSSGVELVYVASPNDRHAEHIAAVYAAGVPVLCEKPLAASGSVARAIRDATAGTGPPVGVAFQYRQHPAHRRARQVVASGVLGELRLVEVSGCLPALDVPDWYADPSVSGGGILPMSGVHRIDLARHIVDDEFVYVAALTAHRRGAPYDDTAAIASRFSRGTVCTFLFGLDAPQGDDRIAIHGSSGSLVVESTMSQWWASVPGSLTVRTSQSSIAETFEQVDNYQLQVADFARFVDGEQNGIATVDDAVAVAEFTEAAYASDASRRVLAPSSVRN